MFAQITTKQILNKTEFLALFHVDHPWVTCRYGKDRKKRLQWEFEKKPFTCVEFNLR